MSKRSVSVTCLTLLMSLTPPVIAHENSLRLLGAFETLESLSFSPDGVAFGRGHLFIASADGLVPNLLGIFEVTPKGDLVDHRPFPASGAGLGFSITRASSGPAVGHFFLATYTGTPDIQVFEFDADLDLINTFDFRGSAFPGDAIAFNHFTQNLAITDVSNVLFEVTTSGDVVRSFPIPTSVGLTFNRATGTYFAADFIRLVEFSASSGNLIREFNLSQYGVKQAVGIASGQGRLFIADEIDPPNSGGLIWTFKSPKRAR